MPALKFEYQVRVENHVLFKDPADISALTGREVGCRLSLNACALSTQDINMLAEEGLNRIIVNLFRDQP